jgi:hypothetical protein
VLIVQCARFIVPDCRISLVQFCFDVLVLMHLFWLFGIAKLYTKLALFTSLYRDAWSTKHKILQILC